jgi:hypothetical protein
MFRDMRRAPISRFHPGVRTHCLGLKIGEFRVNVKPITRFFIKS